MYNQSRQSQSSRRNAYKETEQELLTRNTDTVPKQTFWRSYIWK